ncbi:alpha/beta fold hydrolase [Pseudomonas orientalis]|uniref:alpha/beta fold hydrolase n=1 Tax=Pseudomonas orientalis TaxID=76758 RepID=UPI0019D2DC15|nr:alpha/beta hydrolase [Pseudomonas orientalis]
MIKQRMLSACFFAAVLLGGSACATRQPPEWGIRWLPDCDGRPFTGLDPEVVARTQCGIATVPLDHLNPTLGTLKLDITRVWALLPAEREGAVFTNPGGPGAEADGFTVLLASIWKGYADQPQGEAYRRLINAYDVIGMTPRGMGSDPQSQLVCQSDEEIVAQNDITEDRSPANIEAIRHNAGVLARGCARQRLAPYINTEQTARDMELVRMELNEPQLNYFGNSYGTWLGAWYAGLFPKQVGRMVLDSSTDWTATFQDASLVQAPEKERVFALFVAQRAADDPRRYQMGSDLKAIGAIFLDLLPQVRAALRSDNEYYSVPEYLMAARTLSRWLRESPDLPDAKLLAKLQAHRFSPDPVVNAAAKQAFARLLEVTRHPSPWNGLALGPLKLTPRESVRSTVLCNDSASADEAFWTEKENQYAIQYPVGGSFFPARHCADWRGKPLDGVPQRKLAQVDGLFMVQAEYDDQAPAAGALKAFRSVPAAHMTLLKGAYRHGVSFSGTNACVNKNVGDFLAYGRKPDRFSICYE